MWKACRDHGESQAPTGATGHTGPDGSSPFDRMERYGHVVAPAGENLAWGSFDANRMRSSNLLSMMVYLTEATDSTSSMTDTTSTVHISWKVVTKSTVHPSVRTSARLPGPWQQTTTTHLWPLSLLSRLLIAAQMHLPVGQDTARLQMLPISKLQDSLKRQ
jgi:hypothetical protein